MKILTDSNIFTELWNNPAQKLVDFFSDGSVDIVVCGAVVAELLYGAHSRKILLI